MEGSLGSSVNEGVASKEEESGWTAYFDDFLSQKADENNNTSCSHHISSSTPSLISDAASSVPWSKNHKNQTAAAVVSSPVDRSIFPTMPKKLRFKKTRTKEISHDDSLEDTATSPVNSPKVCSLKHLDGNPRTRDENSEYSELKNKGLCLVPLSMLLTYLG